MENTPQCPVRAISLAATIDGERRPPLVAQKDRGGRLTKAPDLAQALEGSFEDHHARMVAAILSRPDRRATSGRARRHRPNPVLR
jgi:hypothetical protein